MEVEVVWKWKREGNCSGWPQRATVDVLLECAHSTPMMTSLNLLGLECSMGSNSSQPRSRRSLFIVQPVSNEMQSIFSFLVA